MAEWFVLVLLVLAVFIVTYVITSSAWPPAEWFRDRVHARTGADSGWSTLVTCSWCASAYVAAAFVAGLNAWFIHLPLPALWWLAVWGGAAGLAAVTDG